MAANWLDRLARASATGERLSRRELARPSAAPEPAGETRLEAVARALAEPMPRRRMLALTGAALGSAAFGGLRPGRAWATHCPPSRPVNCHAGRLSTCCFSGQLCCANSAGFGGCLPGTCKCCVVSEGNCGVGCCAPDATCCAWTAGAGTSGCHAGQAVLICCRPPASLCRPEGTIHTRCVAQCPPDEVECGTRCCKPGDVCLTAADGSVFCAPCPPERECGDICCETAGGCYVDAGGTRRCCPAGQETCGSQGGAKNTCCPPDSPQCCPGEVPGHESATCCGSDETCFTDGGGEASCCPAGQETCGSQNFRKSYCCPPEKPQCCSTPEESWCCPSGATCYVNTLAVDRRAQPSCCPAGQVVCSFNMPMGGRHHICCAPNEECCGGLCCPSGRCVTDEVLGIQLCKRL